MNYAFVGSGNYYLDAGGNASITYPATLGNTLVVYALANLAGTQTVSDGLNMYNFIGQLSSTTNLAMWWSHVTTGGSLPITLTGSVTYGFLVMEYSGLAAIPYIASSFQTGTGATSGNPNAITTTSNPNVTTAPAMLCGLTVDFQAAQGGSQNGPIAGTSLAYNSRTVGWLGGASQQTAVAEDVRISSAGANPVAFTPGASSQFDSFYTVAAAFAEATSGVAPTTYFLESTDYF